MPIMGKRIFLLLLPLLLVLNHWFVSRPSPADTTAIRVSGTELQVIGSDGEVLAGRDLIGAVVSFSDGVGGTLPLRIDGIRPDPSDQTGELLLYRFLQESATGDWQSYCPETHDGLPVGFPVKGSWGPDGSYRPSSEEISLICANSAVGKCLRLGYKPWSDGPDGKPLRDYHQACTRAIRADYCGDGQPRTRNGTAIQLEDRLGLRASRPSSDRAFEALWSTEGALCLQQPRLGGGAALEEIFAACPRLRDEAGGSCHADDLKSRPGALFSSFGRAGFSPE